MNEAAELLRGATSRLGPARLAERRESLPDPVRRYMRAAIPIPSAAPDVAAVHITHGGSFRTSPGGRWLPISAEEWHTLAEPGFVWRARFSPMPFIRLSVTDSLVAGRGYGVLEAAGRLPVATQSGPEIDQSSAARWLMEAVWFPLAYLGPCIQWDGVDTTSARVTLTSIPNVSVLMHFDHATGLPSAVECERYMNKTRRPFRGTCALYRNCAGILVPTILKGSWLLPDGEFAFADFELHDLTWNPEL